MRTELSVRIDSPSSNTELSVTTVSSEDGIMLFQPGSFADPYRAYGAAAELLDNKKKQHIKNT